MEAYLVTFALDPGKGLEQRYNDAVEACNRFADCRGGRIVKFTKTTFVIKCGSGKRDTIRDTITRAIQRGGSDGRVLVVEITGSAWTCHWEDHSNLETGKELRSLISGED